MESFLPAEELGKFLVQHLDLATFRNSLGPKKEPRQRTFKDFELKVTKTKKDEVEIDSGDWLYRIIVLRRGDFNRDGIEDVEVCFKDKSKVGTYDIAKPLLLTRYSMNGYVVALNWDPDGAC